MPLSPKLSLTLAALAALGLVAVHPAAAQTIISSFQADGSGQGTDYTGAGAANNANFIRTPYTFTDSNSFYHYSATNSGVTLTYDGNFGYDAVPANPADIVLFRHYDGVNGTTTPGVFALSGLAANSTYQLYLYGVNGKFHSNSTTFSATDGLGITTSASTVNKQDISFALGDNYVILTGNAGSSGKITGTYHVAGGGSGESDFNGLQIAVTAPSPAPEPSQVGLLLVAGLGLSGLLLKARKSRAPLAI